MIPRKRFGQNFLQDENVIQHIVAVIAPKQGENLVEIGPGLGALTTTILPLIKTMNAIELDRDLVPKLITKCAPLGDLKIHQADALKFDFNALASAKHSLRVIGNLPYNISTPLLFHLLDYIDYIKDMHFMLQKEVVDRLAAKPNTKQYGRLSVMMQYFCQVDKLFAVPPEAFYPIPKVDSAVVKLVPRPKIDPKAKDINTFSDIVKQSFSQRRKTIKNNLKKMISTDQLLNLGIAPTLRPQQLTIADFVKISNVMD